MRYTDISIVGAGIMGLAHAWHAARAGMTVSVFERSQSARGASIRNFGMLAVVAQAQGSQMDRALRALKHWQEIAPQAGVEITQAGCLFLARAPEEMQVLEECISGVNASPSNEKLIKPQNLTDYAMGLRTGNLLGGLWSSQAWKVDQRLATRKIASWLQREYGVSFHFGAEVKAVMPPIIETSAGTFKSGHVIVCGGCEFSTLFPQAFAESGVALCELQMLRTAAQPSNWTLKPFVLGGLSMTRYSAFENCPGLARLIAIQQERYSTYLDHGIHVIASQESDGSVTIGDSHRYTNETSDQRSTDIDKLILSELDEMMALPELSIEQRWLGHYAHLPGNELLRLSPVDNVTVVTSTNGQGMTHAFAQAEDVIGELSA